MLFNTIKVIHIFSMIAWMVGLLYLPRLFVNHANAQITKETSETFKLMERKLYRIIMFPAFIVTWISGLSMTHYVGIDTWLIIKIGFVILLSIYHFFCLKCINDFKNDNNKYSTKFFRISNEVPSVILIFIIILVVFQPF
ncbi:protoporphyrinogen oxidase HemJ [Pelagibacteraceae bacterium]|nr:protoporphyrinogen oxidase HemJ [Pelagibacteraceae bacterium]